RVMPYYNINLTATARFPGLDIEVVHRRAPGGDREEISICLQAVPSFEGFGRFLEAANPFIFWAEITWLTWLEAARALMPIKRHQHVPNERLKRLAFLETDVGKP